MLVEMQAHSDIAIIYNENGIFSFASQWGNEYQKL